MEAFKGPSLDGDLHDDDEHGSDVKGVTLSDAAQTTIHDIFKELDRNHDGKLQIPEIKASSARQAEHIVQSLCHTARLAQEESERACKTS